MILYLGENFVLHRPFRKPELWSSRILKYGSFCFEIQAVLIAMSWFLLRYWNTLYANLLDFVRVVATFMVFTLHISIATSARGIGYIFSNPLMRVLETPAWGGVWVFFILGGYFAELGFSNGKYDFCNFKSVLSYYKKRLVSTYIPVFAFICFNIFFSYPAFIKQNPVFLKRLFTFTYNGNPGVAGVGATWFVFTMFWFYLCAPFFSWLLSKIKGKFVTMAICAALAAAGFLYRFMAQKHGLDWYSLIYTPCWANLDLFACGMIFCRLSHLMNLQDETRNKICKIGIFVFCVFILINSETYEKFYVYQIIYPTVYILIFSLILVFYKAPKLTSRNKGKLCKLIKFWAKISLPFYLFHSLVMNMFLLALPDISNLYVLHFTLLFATGIVSVLCSLAFNKIFKKNNVNNKLNLPANSAGLQIKEGDKSC